MVIVASCALLAACQSYAPLPLPTSDNLASSVAVGPELRNHLVESSYHAPGSGPSLSMLDAATLAVLNNPDLKAAAQSVKVADA